MVQIEIEVHINLDNKEYEHEKAVHRRANHKRFYKRPKIKLDLIADEQIVEEPKKLRVFHDYSDEPSEKIYIHAYPIEELFAEKLRALAERCRPRDLYDVIMIFRKKDHS